MQSVVMLNVVMSDVIMLNVVMLDAIMLSALMLRVVAPLGLHTNVRLSRKNLPSRLEFFLVTLTPGGFIIKLFTVVINPGTVFIYLRMGPVS
jgi:hypothetical protein